MELLKVTNKEDRITLPYFATDMHSECEELYTCLKADLMDCLQQFEQQLQPTQPASSCPKHESHRAWETYVSEENCDGIPTFANLTTFLDSRICTLELTSSSSPPMARDKLKTFQENTTAQHTCILCSENHLLCHCKQFGKLDPDKRSEYDITDIATHFASHFTSNRKSSLLATAVVPVRSSSGQTMLLRALIDLGSEASFVSERAAQRLQVIKTPTHARVTEIGSTETQVRDESHDDRIIIHHHLENLDVHNMLKSMYIEETCTKSMTADKRLCEKIYTATAQSRRTDGRYVVKLPLKSAQPIEQIGQTRDTALKRFYQLERRLKVKPQLKEDYILYRSSTTPFVKDIKADSRRRRESVFRSSKSDTRHQERNMELVLFQDKRIQDKVLDENVALTVECQKNQ
ncbi:Uncharacterized protein OBRU01_14744 [Operophtera brumata]|uniref:Uncharacterized protein n=1 Tax=Operophtera brumata TaxID=104452 RepID=A0A0L7L610_OPEBR|nr:Uncharacterized protein OBRU01_14744 [Operophtera brumata]